MGDPAPRPVRDPGAYVVRSIRPALDGRVHYEIVDMAGRVSRVTVPRSLTLTEHVDPVLRYHVASRPTSERRP